MPDDFETCEALVRDADRDRFVSALFAPTAHRRALHALYAFDIELARVRELAREPMPGEIRLQWWREVLDGQRPGEESPVASAVQATIGRYRLPLGDFTGMIDARSFDLYDDPMGSLAELEGYADKTSSALIRLAAQVLNDGADPGVAVPARHAGIAGAITRLLTAFPLHASRRQLYVPLDLLQRHGARPEDVFAGTATAELTRAMAELRDIARGHLGQISAATIPAVFMPSFLPVALVRPTLASLERGTDPFKPRTLAPWRRQWLLWRAARDRRRLA
jgi:15-cis-phytoene synthase